MNRILTLIAMSVCFAACNRESTLVDNGKGGHNGGEFVDLSVGVSLADTPETRAVPLSDVEKAVDNAIIIVAGKDSTVLQVVNWNPTNNIIKDIPAQEFPILLFTLANLDSQGESGGNTIAWNLIDEKGEPLDDISTANARTLKEVLKWKIQHRSKTNGELFLGIAHLPKTGIQSLALSEVTGSLTLAVKNRVARIDVVFPAGFPYGTILPKVEAIGVEKDEIFIKTNNKRLNFRTNGTASSTLYVLPRSLPSNEVNQDIIMSDDSREQTMPMPAVLKGNYRYVVEQKPLFIDTTPIELDMRAGEFKVQVTHTTNDYQTFIPGAGGGWLKQKSYQDITPTLREYTYSYSEGSNVKRGAQLIFQIPRTAYVYTKVITQRPSKDLTYKTLYTGDRPKCIDFVIIGDGFTIDDNEDGGAYDKAVLRVVNEFFSREPFKTYKNYFNVYQVYANSNKRGAMDRYDANNHDTKFQAAFNYLGVPRALGIFAPPEVRNKYLYLPLGGNRKPYLSLALVNDTRYGGTGGGLAVASMHTDAVEIAIHELAHKFKLNDEYVDASVPQPSPGAADSYYNLSSTNDRTKIKWKKFFTLPAYKDQVGIYEGGYYLAKGIWRSSDTSIMKVLGVKYFNAVSRDGIVQDIMEQVGETYSFQNFLDKDKAANATYRTLLKERTGTFRDPIPLPPASYWAEKQMEQVKGRERN